ncbi:MAG: hypothetical protein H7122_19240, partial [Chitinophagaceae bacterium]|nr:hypothetical protein [Chitinophagaceae bacterium]
MKKVYSFFIAAAWLNLAMAQTSTPDTAGLQEQKDKIIFASTILKIENLGENINSD